MSDRQLHPFPRWDSLTCTHSHMSFGSSELSLGRAGAATAGAPRAAPHSLHNRQLSVCILQNFSKSTLVHVAAPYYLRPFSGPGSPAYRYCSVLFAPHSFQDGELHVSTQQHPTISALSLVKVALQVGTAAFCLLCTLFRQGSPLCAQPGGNSKQHHAAPAGSMSERRRPLYAGYGVLLFLLGLAPVGVAEDVLQCPAGSPENLAGAPAHYLGSGEM